MLKLIFIKQRLSIHGSPTFLRCLRWQNEPKSARIVHRRFHPRWVALVALRPLRLVAPKPCAGGLVAPKRSEGGSPAQGRRNSFREPKARQSCGFLAYAPAFGLRRVYRRFGPCALSLCGAQLQLPGPQVSGIKSQFYSGRLSDARRGYSQIRRLSLRRLRVAFTALWPAVADNIRFI